MVGFLPTVIAVTLFARLIKLALPKEGALGKYVSVFLGICVCAVMIVPIADFLVSLEGCFDFDFYDPELDIGGYESMFGEEIAENLYPAVEEYIRITLKDEFGVNEEDVEIYIEFDTEGDVISLRHVAILLKNSARFKDTGKISNFFEEKLLCVVDVSVDFD